MGFAKKAILAGCAGFAAAAIVGCGGNGTLLSASQASRLNTELDDVSAALASDQCAAAQRALRQFRGTVNALGGVNPTLISNLNQGQSTTMQLAQRECPTHHTSTHPRTTATTVTKTRPVITKTTPIQTTVTTTITTQPTTTTQTGTTTPATGGTGVSYRNSRKGSGAPGRI